MPCAICFLSWLVLFVFGLIAFFFVVTIEMDNRSSADCGDNNPKPNEVPEMAKEELA